MAKDAEVLVDEEPIADAPVERTLREELLAAQEEANARYQNEAEDPAPRVAREPRQAAVEPRQEAPRQDARPRDATGKFLPKEPAAPVEAAPEAPTEPVAAAPEVPAEPPGEPAPADPLDPLAVAPSTWPGPAKAKWETIPADIRQVIVKREQDIMRGFTQQDSERSFGRELRQIVQPYEAILRASNMTPQAAIQSVLNTAYILRTADPVTKAQTLRQVAKDYGVDLNLLSPGNGAAPPQPAPFEPIVSTLQQRLDQQDARWQAWQNQQQQAAERAAADIYESFAKNPANKYFAVPAIQTHMGALMQAGVCKTMDEAYKMACAAQPEVASRIAAENTAAAKAAEAKRLAAEKARRKGTSVRGGPGGYTPPAPNMAASVRDDIMAAIEESNSRI